MILSKEIEIKVAPKNRLHYSKKLNKDLSIGEIIIVPINFLPEGTKVKIEVLCDYCESNISKVEYRELIKSTTKYACKKCWGLKMQDIFMEKYGVKNPFEVEEIKNKIKNTMINRYGSSHPMRVDSIKEKVKETCLKKYGKTHHLKCEDILEKQKQTNIKKYNVDNISKLESVKLKVRQTNMGKYGVDSYSKTKEFKKKFKETSKLRYGVENPMQNSEVMNKTIKTNMERYGFPHTMSNPDVKEKSKITNMDKYGSHSHMTSEKFRIENFKISKDKNYLRYLGSNVSEFQCDLDCDHKFSISLSDYYNRIRLAISLCTICNPIGDSISIKEKDLHDFIKSIYKGEIIQSYKDGLEIDIFLPSIKIGFELNGIYWHSEEYKNKHYHINKTNHFRDKGIRIIHIWEDDWSIKKDIVKSQIRNWIGMSDIKIGARKCYVSQISDPKIVKEFLNENHIQGESNSIIKLGLYYNNDLISVMTFDHSEGRKKMIPNEWNLSRFCNKINTNVIGGASKMLRFFTSNFNPSRIISYADLDWSDGNIYKLLGFSESYRTEPDYKYVVNNIRVHKSRFRKSKLNTNLSESKYMQSMGVRKIFDCGKIKFELYPTQINS